MKLGTHAVALAVIALSTTASLAAPTAPAAPIAPVAPAVGSKGGAVEKGAPAAPHKSITLRCPSTTDDGSGLPALTIAAVTVPPGWRAGSSTAIRLMSATVTGGRLTCAYGGLQGAPAMRTSMDVPAGYTHCVGLPDRSVECTN